jgi:hypothetical protein
LSARAVIPALIAPVFPFDKLNAAPLLPILRLAKPYPSALAKTEKVYVPDAVKVIDWSTLCCKFPDVGMILSAVVPPAGLSVPVTFVLIVIFVGLQVVLNASLCNAKFDPLGSTKSAGHPPPRG